EVIGILEGQELAVGAPNSAVSRRGGTGILLSLVLNGAGVTATHLGRLVGRAVVDHDDLKRTVGLGQDAVERLGQKACPVVDRDDATDQRSGGHGAASRASRSTQPGISSTCLPSSSQ